MSVQRFIRFIDESGAIQYGELLSSATTSKLQGTSVEVLSGNPFNGFSKTGKQSTIKKVWDLSSHDSAVALLTKTSFFLH